MSIFHTATVSCPYCGAPSEVSWAASVNADRRPDFRDAILARSFQEVACSACDQPVRLPPHLTYVDMSRDEWILVEDPAELGGWADQEAEAIKLFQTAFGSGAPRAVQDMGSGVRPRLVFGWPALREKLVCKQEALDDAVVELAKMAILRRAVDATLGPGEALRLVDADGDTLSFQVTHDHTGEVIAQVDVPRALYDGIVSDPKPWAALRDELAGQAFVDIRRFFVASEPTGAVPTGG